MEETTNYALKKLGLTDAPPDITVLNPNWDKIDEVLKSLFDEKAKLDSPTFTGSPAAPTPVEGDMSNLLATTQFVKTAMSDIDMSAKMDKTKYVPNADMNTLLADGSYICAGTMRNTPMPNTYCFVRTYDSDSTNRIVQFVSVPQTDNTVRFFYRQITGSIFGVYGEIPTKAYVDNIRNVLSLLIEENTFRNDSLANAMTRGLSTLFIETFDNTDDVDLIKGDGAQAIADYYNEDGHVFEKNDTGQIFIYSVVKIVTAGNNNVWAWSNWSNVDGGSVELAVSRNNGTTYTVINNNSLVNISSQSAGVSMIMRVKLTGKLKFKNIAWGCKA